MCAYAFECVMSVYFSTASVQKIEAQRKNDSNFRIEDRYLATPSVLLVFLIYSVYLFIYRNC